MRGACSEPHKRGSAKTCAEHMHRRLLQTAFWPLAELSQRVPNNIQSRTNAQSSVSPTSLQMQCKLHLQKPGWYKKQSPALGICLHPMQLDYKAHVLKQSSRHRGLSLRREQNKSSAGTMPRCTRSAEKKRVFSNVVDSDLSFERPRM